MSLHSVRGLVRLGHVTLHVQCQVIGAGKAAFADLTLEGLSTRVLAVMTSQLVRTGKAPLTFRPLTAIRFLPWERKEERREKDKELDFFL